MVREIREFTSADAAAAAQMFNEWDPVWPGTYTNGIPFTAERVLEEGRRHGRIATFLAVADGRVVGYCLLTRWVHELGAAYIGMLGVSPGFHKQGFGRDLLRAALARTIEVGCDRLDLHTWAANLRAVPLYKKMGFFWVPGTQVYMQNYLPSVLRMDIAKEFLDDADWYTCFRRDLSVKPDDYSDQGMRVYPYVFERGERHLRVLVDPQARGIAGVETDEFAIACRVRGERFPVGLPVPVQWQIVNRKPEAGPLAATVIARGEEGIPLDVESHVSVEDDYTLLRRVVPDRDARERRDDEPAHRVRTTAIVGQHVIGLATGLRLRQPVDVSVPGDCVYLKPGVARQVTLSLRSEVDAPVRARLSLSAPAEVSLEPALFELSIPAMGLAGVATVATARDEGAYSVQAHLRLVTPDSTVDPKPASLSLHSVAPGGAIASFDDRQVLLTTAQLRVAIARRGAGISIADAPSGGRIGRNWATIGPPREPGAFEGKDFEVAIERKQGCVVATLSCPLEAHPGVLFQRKIELAPGPVVRIWHGVINGSESDVSLQVSSGFHFGLADGGAVAIPLAEGLVVEECPEFPDWLDPDLGRPERFSESWTACARDGLVGGCVWERASSVRCRPDGVRLVQDISPVGPSATVDSPSIWLWAGPGDWRAVRHLWRETLWPQAPVAAEPVRQVLEARLNSPTQIMLPCRVVER